MFEGSSKSFGQGEDEGVLLEVTKMQSYAAEFLAILSPVQIVPPMKLALAKSGLLRSSPLSHAKAMLVDVMYLLGRISLTEATWSLEATNMLT
jgi:hypothetical protein